MTPPPRKFAKKPVDTPDRHLRILFDNTNEHAICMLDTTGRIINWNMSAQRMMGYTSAEVIGKNYSIFFSKEEVRRDTPRKALAIAGKKASFAAEGIRVRKDGTHFWARSFITPAKDGEKGTKSFVLITQDITHGRALEQKREEYIAIASHELKNPITTLSLYSELLAKQLQLESDKKSLKMLRDIQGQAARLTALVDDLLIVSKLEGGTLELQKDSFSPVALITRIVRDFRNGSVSHKIIFSGTFPHLVYGDKERIAQVFINLLTNAVKYSPGGKKIVVLIRRVKNTCVISVQDFGPGIAKKDQRDIFTRFFRSNDAEASNIAGSGLGLYISKEIIKKHHQKLWVVSALGRGTTFSFTLALSR